jgi:hypothetical protein
LNPNLASLETILSSPVKFTNYLLSPLHELFNYPDKSVGLEPWQEDWLNCTTNQIGNVTRQGGKTTLSMVKTVWKAITIPNSLHLVYASQDQVKEDMYKVHNIIDKCDANLNKFTDGKVRLIPTSDAILDVILPNKARILGRAVGGKMGEAVIGKSAPHTIVIDECRLVPDKTFLAIYPMTAANPISQLIFISTPGNMQGWYFEEWRDAWDKRERIIKNGVASPWSWKSPDYTIFKVPWNMTLHVDKDKVAKAREKYGDLYVKREFECEFVQGEFSYFGEPSTAETFGASLDIPDFKSWEEMNEPAANSDGQISPDS